MMARGLPVAVSHAVALAAVALVVVSAALVPIFGLYVPAGLGGLALVFLTWRWPEMVLLGTIPVLFLADPIAPLHLREALAGAIAITWIGGLAIKRWTLEPAAHGLLGALALWLVVSFYITSSDAGSDGTASHDLLILLLSILICAAAVSIRPSSKQIIRVTALTMLCGAAVVLTTVSTPGDRNHTLALGLGPNYLALALAMGAVAAGGLSLTKRSLPWAGAAIVIIAAIIQTRARGEVIATIAGLGVIFLAGKPHFLKVTAILIMGGLLAFPGVVSEAERVIAGPRPTAELLASNEVRLQAAATAARFAIDHPLFGIGHGQFQLRAALDPYFGVNTTTSNEVLGLAAESGIPAASLFLMLFVLALRGSTDPASRQRRAILTTYGVGLLFNNPLSSPGVSMPFWLLLACAISVATDQRIQTQEIRSVANRAA